MPPQDFSDIKPKPEIGVVLASFDMHFNYKKMSKAFNYLANNEGCVLLLSNDDAQVPLHSGGTAAGELYILSNFIAHSCSHVMHSLNLLCSCTDHYRRRSDSSLPKISSKRRCHSSWQAKSTVTGYRFTSDGIRPFKNFNDR